MIQHLEIHMKRITILSSLIILTALLALNPGPATGAVEASVEDRINRLEEKIKELEQAEIDALDNQDKIVSDFVKISGYADAEYRLTDKDKDNSRFRIRHLSLFFSKNVQEKWKFFSEIEFEDAPFIGAAHDPDDDNMVQGHILVEQVYIEYTHQLGMELTFGRFLTPAGIWSIYHYYPYIPTQTSPLFIGNIFPHYSDGIQGRKAFNLANTLIDTHFYVSNGSGNPGQLDRNNNKAVGARLNFSRDLFDAFDTGISFHFEEDNDTIQKNSLALHLKLIYNGFKLQTEYAIRNNSPDVGTDYDDSGFYAQLCYDFGKWTVAGRYDWYDPDDTASNADQYRYTTALNYHFAHNVVGKAEYNINKFDDPLAEDYNEFIMAIVIAIGEL